MNGLGIGLQQGSKTRTETQSLCDTGQDSICKKKLSNNCAQLCVFNFIFVAFVRGGVHCQLLQLVLAFISQSRNDIETWFLHQSIEQALAK